MVTPRHPWVPVKKFGQFGPAFWPAVDNKIK